jgi:hypothetical protein
MNNVNGKLKHATESHLQRVIEPLANYIAAASQPRAALKMALAVLLSEIDETNRTAIAQLNCFVENHWS